MFKLIAVTAGLLASSLAFAGTNIAPQAQVSASSTFCSGPNPSLHCYDARRANDGSTNTSLGGVHSWANGVTSLPQWWQASWKSDVRIDAVTVYTSAGYPIQDYDLQYYDAASASWQLIREVRGNTQLSVKSVFSPVVTKQFRVVGRKGPNRQTVYVRLNEVVIEGEVVDSNIATKAKASASSTFCSGVNPSLHCYDPSRANDGDTSTKLGGFTSWANDRNTSLPQWWQASWDTYVRVDSVSIYTSEGYPIKDFDIQVFVDYANSWVTLKEVRGNTALKVDVNFNPAFTSKLRVLGRRGPDQQYTYVRLNEVVINGAIYQL